MNWKVPETALAKLNEAATAPVEMKLIPPMAPLQTSWHSHTETFEAFKILMLNGWMPPATAGSVVRLTYIAKLNPLVGSSAMPVLGLVMVFDALPEN